MKWKERLLEALIIASPGIFAVLMIIHWIAFGY